MSSVGRGREDGGFGDLDAFGCAAPIVMMMIIAMTIGIEIKIISITMKLIRTIIMIIIVVVIKIIIITIVKIIM